MLILTPLAFALKEFHTTHSLMNVHRQDFIQHHKDFEKWKKNLLQNCYGIHLANMLQGNLVHVGEMGHENMKRI